MFVCVCLENTAGGERERELDREEKERHGGRRDRKALLSSAG
jgi:hypothetical protein